jgi:uncharacterized protein (DUF2267 family)
MKYEQYANEAHKFVSEVAIELGEPDNIDQADRIMTSVLHTLRDIITPEESLHLISQLPMLLKAIYVNGWHLSKKGRIKTMDEFIECLVSQNPRAAVQDFGTNEKATARTKAVFRVLRNHIAVGEVKDIVAQFPPGLVELWLSETEQQERSSI